MRSVGEVYVLDQNNVPIECIRDLPVSNNKVNEYIEIITQASAAIGDSRPERAIMNSFDAITNEDV
jgi:hypothetical protein